MPLKFVGAADGEADGSVGRGRFLERFSVYFEDVVR